MYAAIRQGKAKTGMAEELTRRIKEGAIPIISEVEGFMAYYVVYAATTPRDRAAPPTGTTMRSDPDARCARPRRRSPTV